MVAVTSFSKTKKEFTVLTFLVPMLQRPPKGSGGYGMHSHAGANLEDHDEQIQTIYEAIRQPCNHLNSPGKKLVLSSKNARPLTPPLISRFLV